jgi:hypothetical protein
MSLGSANEQEGDRIVAVGLLTERDLSVLGQGFRRAYRLEHNHNFHDLLEAIDRAEHAQQECHVQPGPRGA